ncbi:FliM/FliN family flagellar motor C-terminal domain-containing protein [Sulfitobacter delicatus]|uniref:Type III flagellar switch regulator (C-ring) FliN C-term n=1 Tax=Sulfitobacter delicatus TaxID=218672 RepID=A0A1G7PKL4_9RHOB|nr:FliM/FliN family flagellar motor C-terminal domain-containing protein [Sulfitobacter delicatus]SDF85890.1 Type III flagellar switch regulator (C-ring) FliN C-term [Sulfitobacter delicatus]
MAEDQLDTQTDETAVSAGAAPALLRRKAQAGREEQQARAMSLQKAMRLTLAKVADDLFGMAMATLAVRVETRAGDALDGLFDGAPLMMLLDGPNGQRGAMTFDPLLVGALIQQQTMGRVLADHGGGDRVLTATDAAICVPFLDDLLRRTSALPEAPEDRQWLEGYSFGTRAEDPRLVLMALEAAEYRVMHVTIDIAGGVRQGQLTLCLPLADAVGVAPSAVAEGEGADTPAPALLMDNVLKLNADLNIALARLKMPLRDLGALKAGDLLPLPGSSFDVVTVLTMKGRGVAQGALGQVSGQRAVRLTRSAAPLTQPRRRASDRAELDLPEVQFDRREAAQANAAQAAPAHEATAPALPPDLPDLPDLPELPELPDMSDLPGFGDGDLPELSEREAG